MKSSPLTKAYGSPEMRVYELSEHVVLCTSSIEGPQSDSESYGDLEDFTW